MILPTPPFIALNTAGPTNSAVSPPMISVLGSCATKNFAIPSTLSATNVRPLTSFSTMPESINLLPKFSKATCILAIASLRFAARLAFSCSVACCALTVAKFFSISALRSTCLVKNILFSTPIFVRMLLVYALIFAYSRAVSASRLSSSALC